MQTSSEVADAATAHDWRRLHPIALLFGLNRSLFSTVVPLIFGGFFARDNYMFFLLIIAFSVTLSFIFQLMRFFSFRYAVYGGNVEIQEGILSRKVRTIPVQRIHNINTSQNVFARLMGVVRLDIETAGGGETEASMAAIAKKEAARIMDYVQTGKRQVDGVTAAAAKATETQEPAEGHLLHRLNFLDVVVAGATSNRIGFVAFGLLLFGQYMEVTNTTVAPEWMMEQVQDAGSTPRQQLLLILGLGFAALVLGSWLFGVGYALVRWFGFTVRQSGEDLKIRSGMFTIREYTIPLNKMQALLCRTTALRRPFGLFQIQVRSAGHVGLQERSRIESDVLTPIAARDQIEQFARFAFPMAQWDSLEWRPVSVYTRWRHWLGLSLLLVVLTVGLYLAIPTAWPRQTMVLTFFGLGLIGGFVVAHLNWRQTGYAYDRDYVYIKRGFLGLTYWVVPVSKVQNMAVTQSLFQRRRGLASLHIDVAGDSGASEPEIPNIPLVDAWYLFNRFVTPRPSLPLESLG